MTQYESSVSSRGASDDALWVVLVAVSSSGYRIRAGRHTSEVHYYTVVRSLYYCCYRFFILTYCRWTSPGIRYIIYIICVSIGILTSLYNVITTTIDRPPHAIFWPNRVFLREVFIELLYKREMDIKPPSYRNHYRRKF